MIAIIIIVAIALGYYLIQKNKIRREERHQKLRDKQYELIEGLRTMNYEDASS